MALNPVATFDALCLGRRLQRQNGGFAHADVQLLAYLGCLLSLYQSKPLSDWGYTFVGTELGAPFSADLDAAMRYLQHTNCFNGPLEQLQMTDSAESWLSAIWDQQLYLQRRDCLLAAGSTTLSFPIGAVRDALDAETELNRVKQINATRPLLEESSLAQIYEQFAVLRGSLDKEYADLRLPALVWLTALYEEAAKKEVAA